MVFNIPFLVSKIQMKIVLFYKKKKFEKQDQNKQLCFKNINLFSFTQAKYLAFLVVQLPLFANLISNNSTSSIFWQTS